MEPLKPGEAYDLDVEVGPTCIVAPTGYRIALRQGKDYEYPCGGTQIHSFKGMKDSVPFLHDYLKDRPEEKFGSKVTLQGGGNRASYLLLPVIPPK